MSCEFDLIQQNKKPMIQFKEEKKETGDEQTA
jgi:hypothetical protein